MQGDGAAHSEERTLNRSRGPSSQPDPTLVAEEGSLSVGARSGKFAMDAAEDMDVSDPTGAEDFGHTLDEFDLPEMDVDEFDRHVSQQSSSSSGVGAAAAAASSATVQAPSRRMTVQESLAQHGSPSGWRAMQGSGSSSAGRESL